MEKQPRDRNDAASENAAFDNSDIMVGTTGPNELSSPDAIRRIDPGSALLHLAIQTTPSGHQYRRIPTPLQD